MIYVRTETSMATKNDEIFLGCRLRYSYVLRVEKLSGASDYGSRLTQLVAQEDFCYKVKNPIKCYSAIRRLQYMMFALQHDPCFPERVSFVSAYFAITFCA
jgi:hypothetical protein